MNIKLNSLSIKNFKGLKNFTLDINGNNASVFADNGKGKTTLQDAWNWLLFDKDSNNNADTKFTIKPQNEFGQDINHLQTVVEAELLVDDKPLKLKKMREEKWVTRHGTSEKVFDRHEKSYWFDEVPCKAKEYQAKVDELVNESIFRMITDPTFFNTKIDWNTRRNTLIEISGDKTDEQVIASDESLSKLTEILNGRSIDDYKLVLADKLKGLKKERDDLPPRIDELTRSLPNEEPDYSLIEQEISQHKETLSGIEFLMTNATNKANELNKKHQELFSFKGQLEKVKKRIKSDSNTERQELANKHGELFNGIILLTQGIQELKHQIESYQRNIDYGEQELERLRKEWQVFNNEKTKVISTKFEEDDITTNCPTCGQSLPEQDIESKIAEMKQSFETEKNSIVNQYNLRLNQNQETGFAIKEKVELAKKDKELAGKELEEKNTSLAKLENQISELEKEISKPIAEPDYSQDQEYNELIEKIEQLQTELDKPVEDKSAELLQRKADIQAKIDECNRILNGKEEISKKKARIEELKTEEKRVSTLIAELEGHKFLLERFTVAKVNLLEDSINSQFKHVRFKLFEENVTNDGIKETCIALVNTNNSYVKFEDGNLAGQINAGLDIINALCRFYEVTAPIFIDNRESVSEVMEIDSQIINLIKPPTWNELDKSVRDMLIEKQINKYPEVSALEDPIYHLDLARQAWDSRNNTLRVEVQE